MLIVMAKTIKELAIEAYPMRELTAFGNQVDALQFQRLAFMEGANAVLEEIESVMQYNKADERPWLLRGNHLFNELQKIIKELKGE